MSTLFIFMIAVVVITKCDAFFADAFSVMAYLLTGRISGINNNSRVFVTRWHKP